MQIGYQAYLLVMMVSQSQIMDGVLFQLKTEYFKIQPEYFKLTVG
jgi:hypothetical protein